MVGFNLVGQELAVELTFDMQCDDVSVGIINVFGYLCGIIITFSVKKLQELFTKLYGNLCFSLLITVGTIFMSLISSLELKRQEVVDFIDSATETELEARKKYNQQFSSPRLSRLSSLKWKVFISWVTFVNNESSYESLKNYNIPCIINFTSPH